MLLHQLEAFGLLLGFGHRHRQVEAGRHGAEQHFHRLGQDDALAELAGLLACREHQRLLRSVEFAEARDLLDFIGRHRQADPPLDHVEHGLGRFRQVVQVLRGEPEPGAELAPHLGDLDHVGREQRVLRDDVAFVRHVDDRAAQELVAFGDVVNGVDERDVGNRELGVVALAREGGQVHDGDVRLGPRRAGPVEHLAVHALAEHIHGVGHLQQPCAPHLRQRGVAGALAQRVAHIAREHRAFVRHAMLGRIENALADQAAVGACHARFFFVLAAGDHQPRSDLQLAEHVALLVAFHGHAGIGLVFVERIGIQRLYLARRIDQAPGVGERSQTDARARRELHPMHGETQPCREVAEQAEAVARLDDEQARPIDRRHLIQDVVERRALARTRGAEQEQMRVHLPVEAVQRIEGDRAAAAVEERDARMPRALAAAPDRRQVRRMLREHELGVPLALVGSRIEHARQPAQIAVQRRHLVLFAYRLQAGVEHHVDELQAARIELGQVAAAQVERQRAAVELVRAADQAARLLHVLAGLLRGQGLADGLPGEVVEVRLQHVLGRGDQRQAHHRVLGHLVEQRVHGIAALARLARQMARHGWRAQAIHHDHPMRHAVEEPQAVGHVRTGLAEEQALREVGAAGEFDLALLPLFRAAGQRVEAFAVFGSGAEQGRIRVEPAQQPRVDVRRAEPSGFHAGIG